MDADDSALRVSIDTKEGRLSLHARPGDSLARVWEVLGEAAGEGCTPNFEVHVQDDHHSATVLSVGCYCCCYVLNMVEGQSDRRKGGTKTREVGSLRRSPGGTRNSLQDLGGLSMVERKLLV